MLLVQKSSVGEPLMVFKHKAFTKSYVKFIEIWRRKEEAKGTITLPPWLDAFSPDGKVSGYWKYDPKSKSYLKGIKGEFGQFCKTQMQANAHGDADDTEVVNRHVNAKSKSVNEALKAYGSSSVRRTTFSNIS